MISRSRLISEDAAKCRFCTGRPGGRRTGRDLFDYCSKIAFRGLRLTRKRSAIAALIVIGSLFASSAAHAQLLQLVVGARLKPVPGSAVWRDSTKDLAFPLSSRPHTKPDILLIGRDHPNGTRFLVLAPHSAASLPLDFGKDFHGFDEFGGLKPNYFVQVAAYRFSAESTPEIIIAVGNGRDDLMINVLRYHPLKSNRGADQKGQWLVVGHFSGQTQAQLKARTIDLPYGSQGLYEEYQWVKGKFVKTN